MNPTGQPMGTPMPSAPRGSAADAVNLPAIFMMVLGALGALIYLWSAVQSMMGGSARSMAQIQERLADLPPDQQQAMAPILELAQKAQGGGGVVFSLFCVGLAGFVIFAGLQMKALKNWPLALGGAIVMMIPCSTYCCCCLGIPVGIWVIITLTKPEVKSAFS